METTTPGHVDLSAVKSRQQGAWSSGNYAVVGARLSLTSELLCDAVDLQAGWRVLDVATGSGNTALAAARCWRSKTSSAERLIGLEVSGTVGLNSPTFRQDPYRPTTIRAMRSVRTSPAPHRPVTPLAGPRRLPAVRLPRRACPCGSPATP